MKCYDWSNKNLRVVEWIRCSERMPEPDKSVWIIFEDITYEAFLINSSINKQYWEAASPSIDGYEIDPLCFSVGEIDWWMDLPELPEQKEKSIFDRIELPTEIKESDRFSHSVKIEGEE